MKKLEIEKTKPTIIISTLKTDVIKVGLVFSISNFFIAKTSLANNWRSFSSSYLALVASFLIAKGLLIIFLPKDVTAMSIYNFLLLRPCTLVVSQIFYNRFRSFLSDMICRYMSKSSWNYIGNIGLFLPNNFSMISLILVHCGRL